MSVMGGVGRFQDLVTWQRMHELSVEIRKVADRAPIATDYKFKGQLTEAADSCARNVAEGFARYGPGDFARFLDISRGSATEVRACLKIARDSGYISEGEFNRLDELARRGLEAVAKFQRYLRSEKARRNASVRRYTRPPRSND